MDEPGIVDRAQRAQDLAEDGERIAKGKRAALQDLLERLPVEELHRQEEIVVDLDDVVDLAHVRMVHGSRRARLAPQSLAHPVVGAVGVHALQGDGASQPRIPRDPDLAHSAFAEPPLDFVVCDSPSDHGTENTIIGQGRTSSRGTRSHATVSGESETIHRGIANAG